MQRGFKYEPSISKETPRINFVNLRIMIWLANHHALKERRKDSMVRLFLRFPPARQLRRGLLFVLLWAAMAGAGTIEAATLVVTNTADNGAGSLRAAIAAATEGETIQFDAALNGQTIGLTGGALAIDKNITISGPGPNLLAVSRVSTASRFCIFTIMSGHTVTIAGLTISGGYGDGGGPGGIGNGATLTISNCIVSGNFSDGGSGGGGISSSGTLTIVDSVVSNNRASFTAGNPFGYGGGVNCDGTLTIIRSTISNNTAAIHGGGIIGSGMITITDSTISGNRSGSDNLAFTGLGGGIFYFSGSGMLVINNSTISGNTAQSGDETGTGGGISSGGVVVISNSTVSGNFAYDTAGAFYNGGGTLEIRNSTFSGNAGFLNTDGIFNSGANAVVEIGNTILSDGGVNISNDGGTVTSLGYNLSTDDGGGFLTAAGDQIHANPILGPLQNNGGPTFTHAPQTGSLAINAGDPNFTPPPSFDQRGYARVFGGRIDIGSVEVQPSPTPTPTPTPTATPTPIPSPAQALNISTRLRVETGDNVMIGGFIVYGGAPKIVAVRGIGPSLSGLGLNDTLADPTLELRAANGALLFQNDNWQDDPAQAAQLTALGLAPQNPNESGLVVTLQPGGYTAVLAGKNGGTGVGLVEIYDTDFTPGRLSVAAPTGQSSRLANISTRGFVQTGDNVMIGGFILGGGTASTAIAVRGIGPSLAQSGLSNVLADPTLELRDSNGMLLIANDNWQDDQVTAAQLNGHALAPQDPLESGIFTFLPPGAFTAILAGKNSGVGLGLVEIYNVH